MTRSESLKILDEGMAWLDSLSDEEINELAQSANEYVLKAENDGEYDYTAFETIISEGKGKVKAYTKTETAETETAETETTKTETETIETETGILD